MKLPELPEVETVRRSLEPLITGATITGVAFGDFTGSIAGMSSEDFAQAVTNRTIQRLGRRGKFLLIHLSGDWTIAIHLRMTGELRLQYSADPPLPHQHLTFTLDGDRRLGFIDVRKFGRLRLLDTIELDGLNRSLGPEPLDETSLTPAEFHTRLQQRKRAMKPLLLDQTFLAGIGNIYADEALFEAGIHPLRPASSLSSEEATALLAAIRSILGDAIAHRGTTLRDYRDGLGNGGENQHHLRIYHLHDGEPCTRCGTPISRIVVGQRGTKFCPQCQPWPTADQR